MKNVIELNKDDLQIINGGDLRSTFYGFGYKLGRAVADTVDAVYGFFDGINKAFEEEQQ